MEYYVEYDLANKSNFSNNNKNLTSNIYITEEFEATRPDNWLIIFGQTVAVATLLLGVFANSITIAAYKRSRKLQTSFNCLITNLCAMDLTFSALVMPLYGFVLKNREAPIPIYCSTVGFIFNSMLSASVLNLVFIAINRYVGIVHSSKYRILFSRKLLKWWVMTSWIGAPLLYIPFLFTNSFNWREETLSCDLTIKKGGNRIVVSYHVTIIVILQVLPMFVLVILYREILHKVKRCRKTMEHYPAPSPSSCATSGGRDFLKRIRRISGDSTSNNCSQLEKRMGSSPTRDFAHDSYLKVPGTSSINTSLNKSRQIDDAQTPRHSSSPNLQSHKTENLKLKKDNRRKSWEDTTSKQSSDHEIEVDEKTNFSTRNKIEYSLLSTIESETKSPQSSEQIEKELNHSSNMTSQTPCSLKTDSSTSCEEINETKAKKLDLDQIKIQVPNLPHLKLARQNSIRHQAMTSTPSKNGHRLVHRHKSAPTGVTPDSETSLDFNKNEESFIFNSDLYQSPKAKEDVAKRGYSVKLRRKISKKLQRSNSVGGQPRAQKWSRKKKSTIRIVIDNPSSDGLGPNAFSKLKKNKSNSEDKQSRKFCTPLKRFKRKESAKKQKSLEATNSADKKQKSKSNELNGLQLPNKTQQSQKNFSDLKSIGSPEHLTKLNINEDRRSSIGSRIYRYSSIDAEKSSRRESYASFTADYRTTRTQLSPRECSPNSSIFSLDRRPSQLLDSSSALRTFWSRRISRRMSKCSSNASSHASRRKRRRIAERHLTYSGIVICLALMVYTLPTSVIFVLNSTTHIYFSPNITFAVSILPWLHVIINPLLYGFLNPQYRVEFRKMF